MSTQGLEHSAMCNDLWPLGSNLDIFLAMQEHIHYVMKHEGIHLTEDQLVHLAACKSGIDSLLHSLNGESTSLRFTLPHLYHLFTESKAKTGSTHQPEGMESTSCGLPRPASTPSADSKNPPTPLIGPSSSSMSSKCPLKTTPIITLPTPPPLPDTNSSSPLLSNPNPLTPPPLPERRRPQPLSTFMTPPPVPSSPPKRSCHSLKRMNSKTPPPIPSYGSRKGSSSSSSLSLSLHNRSRAIDLLQRPYRQTVALKGYFNAYLSVFTDGNCQCTATEVTIDETLTITPIGKGSNGKHLVYIQTQEDLYLGSDVNGFLFLGNVTKSQQKWKIESAVKSNDATRGIVIYIRNHYGSYLCAHRSGHVAADCKQRSDWVKFRVQMVDPPVMDRKAMRRNVPLPPPPIPQSKPPPLSNAKRREKIDGRNGVDEMDDEKAGGMISRDKQLTMSMNVHQELVLKLQAMSHSNPTAPKHRIKMQKTRSATTCSREMVNAEKVSMEKKTKRAHSRVASAIVLPGNSGGSMIEELKRKLMEKQKQNASFSMSNIKDAENEKADLQRLTPPKKSVSEVLQDLKIKNERSLPEIPPQALN